jgi:hypothetical protein
VNDEHKRCPGVGRQECGALIFVGEGFGDLCPKCIRHRKKLAVMRRWWKRMDPARRQKVRERHQDRLREKYASDAAYREKVNAANAARRAELRSSPAGRELDNARQRASKYGLSVEEVEAMQRARGGLCGICDDPAAGAAGHIDHDHRFPVKDARGHRGILCGNCNRRLGLAKERRDLLSQKEVAYLDAHAARLAAEDAQAGVSNLDRERIRRRVGGFYELPGHQPLISEEFAAALELRVYRDLLAAYDQKELS